MKEELKPTKTLTEIVGSFTGKISTGRFENQAPFFSIKEGWENVTDEFIEKRQKELHQMCYSRFAEVEKKSAVDKLKAEYAHLRFYEVNGEQFPSVTSILNWDVDFFIPQEDLLQYAARGTIVHKQVEVFLKTGEWKDPADVAEIYPEFVTLSKGGLQLSLDGFNFQAFYAKHPFETLSTEERVVNTQERYAGRADIKSNFENKITIMDIKTSATIDKEKCFKQLAAYAKADGNENVEQLVVIPLNNKTQQGFSKPIITDEIDKYYQLFLKDRKIFKGRFSV